jgi:hypothetical protein
LDLNHIYYHNEHYKETFPLSNLNGGHFYNSLLIQMFLLELIFLKFNYIK